MPSPECRNLALVAERHAYDAMNRLIDEDLLTSVQEEIVSQQIFDYSQKYGNDSPFLKGLTRLLIVIHQKRSSGIAIDVGMALTDLDYVLTRTYLRKYGHSTVWHFWNGPNAT